MKWTPYTAYTVPGKLPGHRFHGYRISHISFQTIDLVAVAEYTCLPIAHEAIRGFVGDT